MFDRSNSKLLAGIPQVFKVADLDKLARDLANEQNVSEYDARECIDELMLKEQSSLLPILTDIYNSYLTTGNKEKFERQLEAFKYPNGTLPMIYKKKIDELQEEHSIIRKRNIIRKINRFNSLVLAKVPKIFQYPNRKELAEKLANEQGINESEAAKVIERIANAEISSLVMDFIHTYREYQDTKDEAKYNEEVKKFQNADGTLPAIFKKKIRHLDRIYESRIRKEILETVIKLTSDVLVKIPWVFQYPDQKKLTKKLAKEKNISEFDAQIVIRKISREEIESLIPAFRKVYRKYLKTKNKKKYKRAVAAFKYPDGTLPKQLERQKKIVEQSIEAKRRDFLASINKATSHVLANVPRFFQYPKCNKLAKKLAKEQGISIYEAKRVIDDLSNKELLDMLPAFEKIFQEYLETDDFQKFEEQVKPFEYPDGALSLGYRWTMDSMSYAYEYKQKEKAQEPSEREDTSKSERREDLRYGMPHEIINGVPTDILCNAKGLYPDFSVEELSRLLSERCHLPIEEATQRVKKAIGLSDEE